MINNDSKSRVVIYPDGTELWFYEGKLHRIDGPAIITRTGDESWYNYGRLHRTTGPALTVEGSNLWYVNGTRAYTDDEFQLRAKLTDEELLMVILKYGNITVT